MKNMLQTPTASTASGGAIVHKSECCPSSARDEADDDEEEEAEVGGRGSSSLLSQEKQPFYQRLLQRDNSSSRVGSSTRHRLTLSLVPFLWESSPGLPKPNWLDLPSSPDDPQSTAPAAYSSSSLPLTSIFPLSPPPAYTHLSRFPASARPPPAAGLCFPIKLPPPFPHLHPLLRPPLHMTLSLSSRIRAAFRRRRRTAPTSSSMLLLEPPSPLSSAAGIAENRDDSCSSRCALDRDIQGHLRSDTSSSADPEHCRVRPASSAVDLRGSKSNIFHQDQPLDDFKGTSLLSARPNRRSAPFKVKGCCCFYIGRCEG